MLKRLTRSRARNRVLCGARIPPGQAAYWGGISLPIVKYRKYPACGRDSQPYWVGGSMDAVTTAVACYDTVYRLFLQFLPARRYASAGTSHGHVSVCRKSEFYRNYWTNRAGFGMGASFRPSCTLWQKEVRVSSKIRVLRMPVELCSKLRTWKIL